MMTFDSSGQQMIMLRNMDANTNSQTLPASTTAAASHNEAFSSDGGYVRRDDLPNRGQKLSVRYIEGPGMFLNIYSTRYHFEKYRQCSEE